MSSYLKKFTGLFSKKPKKTESKDITQQQITTITDPLFPVRRLSFDDTPSLKNIEKKNKITEYLKINLGEAEYNYYINFLNSLPDEYKQSLAKSSYKRTQDDIINIEHLFDAIKPIEQPLYAYRCYQRNVTFEMLKNQPNNRFLLSTTLSFEYANEWCNYIVKRNATRPRITSTYNFQTIQSNLVICILIPPGTRVIPLIADYLENKRVQYEILLDDRSTLHYAGTNKSPTGYEEVPLFVYLPGDDIAENKMIFKRIRIYTEQLKLKEAEQARLEAEAEAERIRLEAEAIEETRIKQEDNNPNFLEFGFTDIVGGRKIYKKTKKNKKNKKSKKNQRKGKLIKTKTTTKKNK